MGRGAIHQINLHSQTRLYTLICNCIQLMKTWYSRHMFGILGHLAYKYYSSACKELYNMIDFKIACFQPHTQGCFDTLLVVQSTYSCWVDLANYMTDNTDLVTALQELQSRAILVLEQHLHSEHKPHIVYIGTRLILINLQDIQYL